MRMFKHILCCSARGRTYNRLAILSMAMFLSSFSIVYFIYTSPGRANAYLYQFHIFQNSLYSAMQNGGRGFFEKMANASDLQELEYEPIGFKFLPDNFTYSKDEICPEKFPEMHGKIQVNMSEIPIEAINSKFSKQVSRGGSWQPTDCIAKYQVAIMIPYRNRLQHIPILLRHLYPMLMSQRLNFTIFLIEQVSVGCY